MGPLPKMPHLNVMVCGKYGSLIPIQDKIDLTNAHEKNEDNPEETAVKIEEDNDSEDKIEEFLETSSEVKVEESEGDLVMVSLTPHDENDDLKTEEINEAKLEEFNPLGIAIISSNYIHIWYC